MSEYAIDEVLEGGFKVWLCCYYQGYADRVLCCAVFEHDPQCRLENGEFLTDFLGADKPLSQNEFGHYQSELLDGDNIIYKTRHEIGEVVVDRKSTTYSQFKEVLKANRDPVWVLLKNIPEDDDIVQNIRNRMEHDPYGIGIQDAVLDWWDDYNAGHFNSHIIDLIELGEGEKEGHQSFLVNCLFVPEEGEEKELDYDW